MKDDDKPTLDETITETRDARDATTSAGFPRVAATGADSVSEADVVGPAAPGVGRITHGENLAAAIGATTAPSAEPPRVETAVPSNDHAGTDSSKLDQARDKLYDAARQVRDRVETGAHRVTEEVQRGTRRASRTIHDSTEAGREKVEAGYRAASAQLESGYEQLSETLDEQTTEFDRFVRSNPGRAVLAVAGAGFLLGLLMRGKR